MLKKINKQILFKYDSLQVEKKNEITKHFENGEVVRFSANVGKYNDRKVLQDRILVLTNKRFYNFLKKPGIFQTNLKKKIDIKEIQAISISSQSQQFVIHLDPRNYDIRKMLICEYINHEYQNLNPKQLLIFYKLDEPSLFEFTTSKRDFRRKASKKPKSQNLAFEQIKKYIIDYERLQLWKSNIQYRDFTIKFAFPVTPNPKCKIEIGVKKITERRQDYVIIKTLKHKSLPQVFEKLHKLLTNMHKDNPPFIVDYHHFFQEQDKIYLVMKFMKGGDLFTHLSAAHKFKEEKAKFIFCQVLLGLQYLHDQDLIFRDLKPENILLDESGNLVLGDFIGRMIEEEERQDFTQVTATPEYIAPEILLGEKMNKDSDYWALGCLLYEMLIGIPPFYHQSNQEVMYQLILSSGIPIPSQQPENPDSFDMFMKLLNKNPKQRLGHNGIEEIKNHAWLKNVNWSDFQNFLIEPPLVLASTKDNILENFDLEIKNMTKGLPDNMLRIKEEDEFN